MDLGGISVERLTEKRDSQNVIPLRQNGKVKWAICSSGRGDAPTEYLYGDHADRLAAYEDTGLEPEEIVKMGMMLEDSKRYSGRLELKLRAAKELNPKWIPVTERLPEDRGDVLAVVFWHETWRVKMAWCIPERNEWYVHVGFADRNDVLVSHWMPLPVPPDRRSPKGESDA